MTEGRREELLFEVAVAGPRRGDVDRDIDPNKLIFRLIYIIVIGIVVLAYGWIVWTAGTVCDAEAEPISESAAAAARRIGNMVHLLNSAPQL